MGFSAKLVTKAIKQNREGDINSIIETLLTYGDITGQNADKDRIVHTLVEMGFMVEEASFAIDKCGIKTPISELANYISAAQFQEDSGDQLWVESPSSNSDGRKGKGPSHIVCTRKTLTSKLERKRERITQIRTPRLGAMKKKQRPPSDNEMVPMSIPKPMIGFGLPFQPAKLNLRTLPEASTGPPYFYYENVALATKGAWDTFSRFLYDIKPEFVDSKFFSAAKRKRGYIHNLPIEGRSPLLPIPPKTIHEALPATKKWWPSWDTRTHFNCLQTVIASAKKTEQIRSALAKSGGQPSENIKKWILSECKKWNLVWIGLNKVAPLEPDEMEMLLGFPKNHTRGISRTERYKYLGNTFQVDTVAYHLSVLKNMFPNVITVLSLFSGIGGGEMAFDRLGIKLKLVVTVELLDSNGSVLRSWWDQTNQTGTLVHISDVRKLSSDALKHFVETYNAFDLVIGGSPCNNLAGSNRHHRDGLDGEPSSLFFDYHRILDLVKTIMGQKLKMLSSC